MRARFKDPGEDPGEMEPMIAPLEQTEPCIVKTTTTTSPENPLPRNNHRICRGVALLVLLGSFVVLATPWATRTTIINENVDASTKKFMGKIQRAFRHRVCSRNGVSCSGARILSFDCTDGVGKILVEGYLQEFQPILVCANEIVASSLHDGGASEDMVSRRSIQATLDSKYEVVLLDGSSISNTTTGDIDVWKKMLAPNGFLAVFGTTGDDSIVLSERKNTHGHDITLDASVELSPLQSTTNISGFLTQVKAVYTKQICHPLNKQGWFCQGKVLSLNCRSGPGLGLVQENLHGKATLYCADEVPLSSKAALTSPEVHQKVLMMALLQARYEVILLDSSSSTFPSLEFWKQLLAPGGIIAIQGTLVSSSGTDAWSKQLFDAWHLQVPNEDTPLIIVDPLAHVETKASQDAAMGKKDYKTNDGSLGKQIQVSPMSSEDRYMPMYRQATTALLSNSSCSEDDRSISLQGSNQSCPLKVLSFGCSYGFEMKTLADSYLTGKAEIYGVDVLDPVVERAKLNVQAVVTNKMVVLNGKTDPASNYGPFDAVFANSVLCYNPAPEAALVREKFPFESFTALLDEIDALVKVGGLLSLANNNYRFIDTELFSNKYKVYGEDEDPTCVHSIWLLAANGDEVLHDPRIGKTLPEHCLFMKVRA